MKMNRRTMLGAAGALAAPAPAPAPRPYRRVACEEGFLSPCVLTHDAKASSPALSLMDAAQKKALFEDNAARLFGL
jgi:hypothetical protein